MITDTRPRHITATQQTRILAKIRAKKAVIDRVERPRIREVFSSAIIRWLLVVNITVLAIMAGLIAVFIRPTSHYIILHYTAFFGVDHDAFGPWWWAYRTVAFGSVVLVVNTLGAILLYRQRERIAAYVLLAGAMFVQLALMIATIAVIIVNR